MGDGPEGGASPTADAGPDSGDASTIQADAGLDAAADAPPGDAGPRCDRAMDFANAQPVMDGAQQLYAKHFRIARDGRRAYYVLPTSSTRLRAADLANGILSSSIEVMEAPGSVEGGLGISDAETELVLAFQGTGVLRYTRATATAPFGAAAQFVFTAPSPLPADQVWMPYLPRGGGVVFSLLQQPATGTSWGVFAGAFDAGVIRAVAAPGLKPPDGFMYSSVLADPLHMLVARWGAGPTEFYPRLFDSRRSGALASWETPKPVDIKGLTFVDPDVVIPFDVTADDCELYFGRSANFQAGFNVFRATRPK